MHSSVSASRRIGRRLSFVEHDHHMVNLETRGESDRRSEDFCCAPPGDCIRHTPGPINPVYSRIHQLLIGRTTRRMPWLTKARSLISTA